MRKGCSNRTSLAPHCEWLAAAAYADGAAARTHTRHNSNPPDNNTNITLPPAVQPHFIFDSVNSTRRLTTGSNFTRCSL